MPSIKDLLSPEEPEVQKSPSIVDRLESSAAPAPIGPQALPQPATPQTAGLSKPQEGSVLGDIGTALKRGVLQLPSVAAGVADIPAALYTGTRPFTTAAEKLGEVTGIQPGLAAEQAAAEFSPELQRMQQEISQIWKAPEAGAIDIAKAYLQRPRVVGTQIAESIPSMLAGGALGRGLAVAGRGAGFLTRAVGEKLAVPVAAGAGEGIIQAGQAMSQAEGENQRRAALAAVGSGLLTAVIGAGGGRIAQKLGLETPETLMAKGFDRAVRKELSLGKGVLGTTGRIAGGAVSESIIQELPQSAQEAVFQNYAEGKPLWEGVEQAAVEGAIAGFVMGAGANALPGRAAPPKVSKDQVSEQLLANLIPGSTVTVADGMATVVRDTPAGPTTITAPVEDFSKTLAAGGDISNIVPAEEVAPAQEPEKIFEKLPDTKTGLRFKIRGIEYQFEPSEGKTKKDLLEGIEDKSNAAAIGWLRRNATMVTEQAAELPTVPGQPGVRPLVPGQRLFEKLPETDTALRYRIRGTEFKFEVPEGKTKQDLLEGIEGKSDSAAIGWLRRNSEMSVIGPPMTAPGVAEEVTPTTLPSAAPGVAEEVTPTTLPSAAPGIAEEVAPAAPGIAEEVAPAAPSMAEEVAPTLPQAAPGVARAIQEINPVTGEEVTVEEAAQMAEEVAPTPAAPGVAEEVAPTPAAPGVAEEVAPTPAAPGVAEEVAPTPPVSVIGESKIAGQSVAADDVISSPPGLPPAPDGEISIAENVTADKGNVTTLFAKSALEKMGVTPITTDQAIKEAKNFLGEKGYNNLISKNKFQIINSVDDFATQGISSPFGTNPNTRRIAAVYVVSLGKTFIVTSNIRPGEVGNYLRHEIAHALFREDKVFTKSRNKILEDFAFLAGKDESVRKAFARVPRGTNPDFHVEEALAYWLTEPKNQEHSLFKRIISAVKMALRRIGIPTTGLSTTDIARMFSRGSQAWAEQAAAGEGLKKRGETFPALINVLKPGRDRMKEAVASLANPKSRLHDMYVQHAPKWLAVTPLRTLEQTFGKRIPQIRSFARNLDAVVAAKTDIVDTAAVKHYNAESAAKAGVGVDILNRAAATASFNRMTPWIGMLEQDWVPSTGTTEDRLKKAQKRWVDAKMQQATGMTFQQAYTESKKAYDALKSRELKNAYIGMVDHISSIRTRERNNLLAYIENVSEEGTDLRNQLMAQFNASFNSLQGAYWPLARFGDFILEYTDTAGFRQVQHFQSIAERNAARDTIIEDGIDPATIKEDFKDKQPDNVIAMPKQLMDQLTGVVEQKYLQNVDPTDQAAIDAARQRAQNVVDDMNQIWLRWQPETSALKNSIRRKNVKGFSEDMLRSYLDYMQRHASNIAWSEQGRKIDEDIGSLSEDIKTKKEAGGVDVTMDRHILNDLRSRIQALRTSRVGSVASALGKLGTAYYMTSPSIALVQMSQLGAMTYPNLATKFGPARAAKALSRGVGSAFTKKFTREAMFSDSAVNSVYENMRSTVTDENRGTPRAQGKVVGDRLYSDDEILQQVSKLSPYQKQLLTLREAMARNLLDISAAHETYELTRGGNPNSLRSRAFNLAMLPMSISELTSRKAAILSTLELSEQKGKNFFESMTDISDVVNDTLYSYAKEGKGAALQGGLSRILLQFQHYRVMTAIRLALLFKNAIRGESPEVRRAATKEFVGIMGMTGALAGATGLPFAQAMFGVLDTVLGDEDEPEDYELMFNNWLRENLGETGAGVVAKGLPTLVGADISRRVGLADIYGMQNEPPSGLHGRDLAAWWAASQLGPVFSVGQGWAQGYDEIVNKGNYLKGLEVSTPKPIRDALKAYRVATEGLKTGAGKKILDDSQIGADEVAMIALGFNADEVASAQAKERSLRGISTKISERRGRLIRDAARAIVEGEGSDEALAAIRRFNERMPRFAVAGRDIRPAVRRLVLGELGATGVRELAVAQQYEIPVYTEQPVQQPAARGTLGQILGR